jgi:hypothetical protein
METKDPAAPTPPPPPGPVTTPITDPAVLEAIRKWAEQAATEPKPPGAFEQLLSKLKGISAKQWVTLAVTLLVGGGSTWMLKPGVPGNPGPVPHWGGHGPLSTQQRNQPITIDGCSYWLFTIGEPTNANFSASITHMGNCSNFMAHVGWQK